MTPAIIRDAIRSDYRLADSNGAFFRPDPAPALSDAEYRDLCRRVREAEARAAETYSSAPPRPVAPLLTGETDGRVCASPRCDRLLERLAGESVSHWRARRTCGRSCAAHLRGQNHGTPNRGAAVEPPVPTSRPCAEPGCALVITRWRGESPSRWAKRVRCVACAARLRRWTILDAVAAGEWGPARRGARQRAEATS